MTETNYLFDKIFKSNETKEKIFLINESKKLSYIEFHKVVNKISNYLREIDLSPGDRVAVQAEKNIIQLAYMSLPSKLVVCIYRSIQDILLMS